MIAATTNAPTVPASSSLADSISVASNSSTATPRMQNTNNKTLSSRALTIRNSNAKGSSTSSSLTKSKVTNTIPPSTKRARTSDGVKNDDSPTSDIVPLERRPLPSARELSKVLCRIVDDEAYSDRDAEIALETLHHWALKQNVAFGNHFADVGGLQQVLFFVEDHLQDCKSIVPAFWLMETLCKPLQGASATIYESKALSNMRTKIGKCIVDVGGVHLMLRTFQFHALPHKGIISNTTMDAKNRSASCGTLEDPEMGTSSDNGAESGMWKAFKTMLKTNQAIADDIVMNPCTVVDTMMCMSSSNSNLVNIDDSDDVNLLGLDTSRHSMEVLSLLIPHVIGVDKTAPGKILQTLCDAVPLLLSEMKKHTVASKEENGTTKVEKVYEELTASVLKCLVCTTAVASKETFTNSQLAKSKQIVSVTNTIMRTFPRHHGMNRNGCLILQRVCRHLPKSERKRLGVVASLGSVVASESIDQDVKDIADEILEEQFK
mmetsp:Transcript_34561/g.39443  ORF Transcript_34561/g.39443 Transcript_34561/m.39443 type:complete len:491 (+) Transcript_34561:168-1640(+)